MIIGIRPKRVAPAWPPQSNRFDFFQFMEERPGNGQISFHWSLHDFDTLWIVFKVERFSARRSIDCAVLHNAYSAEQLGPIRWPIVLLIYCTQRDHQRKGSSAGVVRQVGYPALDSLHLEKGVSRELKPFVAPSDSFSEILCIASAFNFLHFRTKLHVNEEKAHRQREGQHFDNGMKLIGCFFDRCISGFVCRLPMYPNCEVDCKRRSNSADQRSERCDVVEEFGGTIKPRSSRHQRPNQKACSQDPRRKSLIDSHFATVTQNSAFAQERRVA